MLSCLAFADDLVLLAKTPRGLQHQFTVIERALGLCGLTLNARKCATLRINVLGTEKTWACNPSDFMSSRDGNMIRAMDVTDGYKYLGNLVCAGKAPDTTLKTLREGIDQLTRAPLKPQQRMFFLKCNLLPSLLHKVVLGRMSRRALDFLDKISRAAIRCWVKLPEDTPMAFFHADHNLIYYYPSYTSKKRNYYLARDLFNEPFSHVLHYAIIYMSYLQPVVNVLNVLLSMPV